MKELFGILWLRRQLTLELTKREMSDQYVGQMFGIFWAVAHPIFLMCLLVFLFGFVFGVRIGGTRELPLDYASYILSGLVPWLGFQQTMGRACSSISGQSNLVKQVIFPLEVLPVRMVLAGTVSQLVSLSALLLYILFVHGIPAGTVLLLPILLLFQIFAMIGVAFALSAISIFFKDLKDFVQVFSSWGVYLAPIVFLPNWLPDIAKPIIYANPFSYMVWVYQDTLYFGRFEHPYAWVVFGIGSILVLVTGYKIFKTLRPKLASAL